MATRASTIASHARVERRDRHRARATQRASSVIARATHPTVDRRVALWMLAGGSVGWCDGARAFAAFGTSPFGKTRAVSPEETFAAVREDARALARSDPDFGPTMVRLAWHSCGTYDRMSRTGGSGGGTIRFKEELAHGGNAGLAEAVARLEPVKAKHPTVSWADLIAFVGAVAIEDMGGPKLQFYYGRVDEMDPSAVTPDGRLPDADKGDGPGPKTTQGLRDVFYRMGFDDREIVALSGAHALGRCHANASGYVGPWTSTPLAFNNSYFVLLKGLKWEPDNAAAKFQYRDPSGQLMMLPSDIALIEDPKFKEYVYEYAKSQPKFFADFKAAFEKLELLGTSGLTPLKDA